MAKLFDIDENGVRTATLSGAKTRFDEVTKEVFGADIDTHTHTPQNQIAGINALVWAEVSEEIRRAALWGASLDHAEGKFLDAFGSLLGIRRRHSTKTRVECLLTGVDGTLIPAGSIVRNKNGDYFLSEEDAILTNGQAVVLFVASKPGSISAEEGEIDSIVTVTDPRWKTVINPRSGIIGLDEESDTEYRNNIKNLTAISSVSTLSSIRDSLRQSGSYKSKIIENASDSTQNKNLISIPPRSLVVIADGGLDHDLTRAYELRRPIGVGTHAYVSASKYWVPGNTSNVNSGAFQFNGTEYTGVNLTSVSTSNALKTKINGLSSEFDISFEENRPLLDYQWDPTIEGFKQLHGNEAEVPIYEGLKAHCVFIKDDTTSSFIAFNNPVRNDSNNELDIKLNYYKTDGTKTTSNSYVSLVVGKLASFSRGAIPNDTDYVTANVKAKMKGENDWVYLNDIEVKSISSGEYKPILCGVNIYSDNNRIMLNALFAGNSSYENTMRLEYIRYDGFDYIDKDNQGNRKWINKSSIFDDNGFFYNLPDLSLDGYTNDREGARLHLRAYIEISGVRHYSDEYVFPVLASNTPPNVDGNVIVDGSLIKINFDKDLRKSIYEQNCNWWDISGKTVTSQRFFGNSAYLRINSPFTSGQSVPNISYDASDSEDSNDRNKSIYSSTRQTNTSSNRTDFTVASSNIDNITRIGLPSEPIGARAFQYEDEIAMHWDSNYNGGQSIDKYEYSISYDNGLSWSSWNSAGTTRTLTIEKNTLDQLPNKIKIRASNPNAQIIEKLGFTGADVLSPITRPIEKALSITIELNNASNLVRNALDDIKNALVERVNQYELGATIWTNDLLAIAELIEGVEITSFSVKHGSSNVNDVEQPAYIKWTLDQEDITFS